MGSVFSMLSRLTLLCVLMVGLVVLPGCGKSDSNPTAPAATTGTIKGTVQLAAGVSTNLNNARVAIYTSVADLSADRVVKETALSGSGATYQFTLNDVTPGTYYLDVCLNGNCASYTTNGTSEAPISVAAGQTANITVNIR